MENNYKGTAQRYPLELGKTVLILQRKLKQAELSLRLLEEAKDRYDRIYNSTITTLVEQKTELDRKNKALEEAIKEIKTLKGIIPICMHCKNIRDDKGYWHDVAAYVRKHSEAEFSHGICPDCLKKHYPECVKTK